MNRLDHLKKGLSSSYDEKSEINNKDARQAGVLEEETQQHQAHEYHITDADLRNDNFENQLQDTSMPDSTLAGDEQRNQNFDEDITDTRSDDIIEGTKYHEKDVKLEAEYIFEQRSQAYDVYFRSIKRGGMEILASEILHLDDIVRISVTITELKQQVTFHARVISVFPPSTYSLDDSGAQQRCYLVQFIGPNATKAQEAFSAYLLGYKAK